jgi:hypothetical protein
MRLNSRQGRNRMQETRDGVDLRSDLGFPGKNLLFNKCASEPDCRWSRRAKSSTRDPFPISSAA